MLNESHTRYLLNLVSKNSRYPKALFKMINTLLNKKKQSQLPDHSSASELAATFNTYFIDKVTLIHQSLEELNHTQSYNVVIIGPICSFRNSKSFHPYSTAQR